MRILLILLLLTYGTCSAQYTGSYTARFINILDLSASAEASLEVMSDHTMTGSVVQSGETILLKGKAESGGRFEVRSDMTNNITIIIKGTLAAGKDSKIELIHETVEKGKGTKKKLSNSITGFLTRLPDIPKVAETIAISDHGRTQLVFDHDRPLFGKNWEFPAIAIVKTVTGRQTVEIEMKDKSATTERRFSIRLIAQTEGQKLWDGNRIAFCSYAESTTDSAGKRTLNYFLATGSSPGAGQVELISVNDTQVVLKINGLWAKRFADEGGVTINGFLYASRQKD